MNLYRLSIDTEDFFEYNNKIIASNISVKDGQVLFYTDKVTLKFLKANNVNFQIIDDKLAKTRKKIVRSKGFFSGLLLFLCLLYFNGFRVSNITFNGVYSINDNVEQVIMNNTKRLFFWDFLSSDLDKVAANIRKEYVEYQWISIEKNGTTVKVIISDFDTETKDIKTETIGNVVAKKTGIITYCNAYQGKKAVELNQYVKEGDILISANKLYNTDRDAIDLTEARGLVLATTYETITHSVQKSMTTTTLTKNSINRKELNFFGLKFNLSRVESYNNYDKEEKTIFNFFGFLKVKKVTEYEKCDIIKTYNENTSVEYLKELIKNDFEMNKTSKLEEILRLEVLYIEETNKAFNIKMLVKKQESIGVFQSLS